MCYNLHKSCKYAHLPMRVKRFAINTNDTSRSASACLPIMGHLLSPCEHLLYNGVLSVLLTYIGPALLHAPRFSSPYEMIYCAIHAQFPLSSAIASWLLATDWLDERIILNWHSLWVLHEIYSYSYNTAVYVPVINKPIVSWTLITQSTIASLVVRWDS